jgi:hypothetical protein
VLILEPGELEEELFSAQLDGSFLETLPSSSARKETSHVNEFYLESIGFCTSKLFFTFFLNKQFIKISFISHN